jgi:Glyoxalase-like domain
MRIRQIVFAAHDLKASRELLAEVFQMAEPFRDPGVAEFGIDNAVFTFGDQFIEIISPNQAKTACGRHLERYGDSGYMLLLQTDHLAREQARFSALGVRSIWSAEFEDIVAMHLHPKDVGAAIVSVDEPRPASSWRWGGPQWRGDQVLPQTDQQRIRGITLGARDPQALATRWADVFGRPVPRFQEDSWRVALSEGFADFMPSNKDSDGVAGFTLSVADPAGVKARAAAAGLVVGDDKIELLGATVQVTGYR